MLVRTLLEVLDFENIVYEYAGPEEAQIYGVQMQNGTYKYKEGILYMQRSLLQPKPPQDMCVIAGDFGLYDILQDKILSYFQKEAALLKMQEFLLKKDSLINEIAGIAEIMGNPCILLREDKKALAWNGFRGTEEFEWASRLDLEKICGENEGITVCYCEQSADAPYALMAAFFMNLRGERRYCIVVEKKNRFDRVLDVFFLKSICTFLNNGKNIEGGNYKAEAKIDGIIKNMFFSPPKDKESIYDELRELGWKKSEKYYVLAVDFSHGKTNSDDMRFLSERLNARVFMYENYYICLIRASLREEYDSRKHLGIEEWLEEKDLYAGLSYGLYDITEISVGYKQALSVIKISLNILKNVHYYTFSESIITYLVLCCRDSGEMDLKHLCHPIVWKIYEYDQEYHTDYIDFLATYIYSERSVKKTAEVLFLHRNTVYQKINKLKEYFNLDVDDHYIYIKLYVSMVVMDQLKHSRNNKFIRWM